jgi:hypothetical protein
MSLTNTKTIDQIKINESGYIQYREASQTFKDDIEVSKTYHVTVLMPGQDLTNIPVDVVAVCNETWTPELMSSYQAKQAELIAKAEGQ